MRHALVVIALLSLLVPGTASAAKSKRWGVVDLGRDMWTCQPGARVVAAFGDQQLRGPKARGCRLPVPSREALADAGWIDGTQLDLTLKTHKKRVPLRYKHLQPDLGEPVAGNPVPRPASDDPQGDARSLLMRTGDAVDLGRADLARIYAIFVRAAGTFTFELRDGAVDGPVLARGTAGHRRPDWIIKPRGAGELYLSATAEITQKPKGPRQLVLVVTDGAGLVNYVDLTGSGAMAPHRFPTPLPGAVPIFDGRSIDGFRQIGEGKFSVEDSSIRGDETSGWGWLYHPQHHYKNFVLRLRVKESKFGANGGILVRHSSSEDNNVTSFTADEVQVTDVNTEYMGGIDHVATALRQPQSSPGRWSTFEIVANGPRLVAKVNGVVTADHDQTLGCNLGSFPCSGGEAGGYLTGGAGFIAVQAELETIWYRDLRVHDCGVTDPVTQTSVDPLCNPA